MSLQTQKGDRDEKEKNQLGRSHLRHHRCGDRRGHMAHHIPESVGGAECRNTYAKTAVKFSPIPV